jgi:HEAT repeat protein
MRTATLLLLLACPVFAQGMGPPGKVDTWASKKNQQRLRMSWDSLPDHTPIKLPDGSTEPRKAPWPFLLYIVEQDSKLSKKVKTNIFDDARFRIAVKACKAIRVRPEKAIDLPYLRSVPGIKDPTIVVLKRDFRVVGALRSQKDFTGNKCLSLMAKASDDAYQTKLSRFVTGYFKIMKIAEQHWREELAIEALVSRFAEKDKARQKKAYEEAEEREEALARAEDDLIDKENDLKGSLLLKQEKEEVLPTTVGTGKKKRKLTPEELEAIQTYREFARSDNPIVRAAAVEDLGAIDSAVMVDAVLKAANDLDKLVTMAAGAALARMKSLESLEAMYAGLKSGKERVKLAALKGFADGKRNFPAATPDLVAMVRGGSDEVRLLAARALGAQKDPAATQPLIQALNDSVPAIRVVAATVLGERRDTAAAPALIAKLTVKDWSMKKAAAEALGRIRAKASIGPLLERFEKEKGLMREVLYKALVDVTGQDFRYRPDMWRRWWDRWGESFVLPTDAEIAEAKRKAADALKGYAQPDKRKYHKIETLSRKIVFVLDVSSSMGNKIVVPPSATEEALKEFPSRVKMEIAKRELIDVLATLDRHVYFNVITFAGRIKPWRDSLVGGGQKNSAIKFVDKLKPVQSSGKRSSGEEQKTNTYGALMEAFGLADAAVPNWRARTKVDTIFLVTDGVPTTGKIVEVPKLIRAITEMNRTRGVIIHVITFDKISGRRLRKLAEQNGGQLVIRGF